MKLKGIYSKNNAGKQLPSQAALKLSDRSNQQTKPLKQHKRKCKQPQQHQQQQQQQQQHKVPTYNTAQPSLRTSSPIVLSNGSATRPPLQPLSPASVMASARRFLPVSGIDNIDYSLNGAAAGCTACSINCCCSSVMNSSCCYMPSVLMPFGNGGCNAASHIPLMESNSFLLSNTQQMCDETPYVYEEPEENFVSIDDAKIKNFLINIGKQKQKQKLLQQKQMQQKQQEQQALQQQMEIQQQNLSTFSENKDNTNCSSRNDTNNNTSTDQRRPFVYEIIELDDEDERERLKHIKLQAEQNQLHKKIQSTLAKANTDIILESVRHPTNSLDISLIPKYPEKATTNGTDLHNRVKRGVEVNNIPSSAGGGVSLLRKRPVTNRKRVLDPSKQRIIAKIDLLDSSSNSSSEDLQERSDNQSNSMHSEKSAPTPERQQQPIDRAISGLHKIDGNANSNTGLEEEEEEEEEENGDNEDNITYIESDMEAEMDERDDGNDIQLSIDCEEDENQENQNSEHQNTVNNDKNESEEDDDKDEDEDEHDDEDDDEEEEEEEQDESNLGGSKTDGNLTSSSLADEKSKDVVVLDGQQTVGQSDQEQVMKHWQEYRDHRGRLLFECFVCGRKVQSSYNLRRHMMIHTGERPFACDMCDRKFREFSDLKKHRRRHANEVNFLCMICRKYQPMDTDPTRCLNCCNQSKHAVLLAAMKTNAELNNDRNVQTSSTKALEEVIKSLQKKGNGKSAKKTAEQGGTMLGIAQVESPAESLTDSRSESSASSTVQGNSVASNDALEEKACKEIEADDEVEVDMGEVDVDSETESETTDNAATTISTTTISTKIIPDTRNASKVQNFLDRIPAIRRRGYNQLGVISRKEFPCPMCKRAFGSRHNLKRHYMIHTGEKPYSCRQCRKPFREYSTLKKHMVTHQRDRWYKCMCCPCKFRDFLEFTEHKNTHPFVGTNANGIPVTQSATTALNQHTLTIINNVELNNTSATNTNNSRQAPAHTKSQVYETATYIDAEGETSTEEDWLECGGCGKYFISMEKYSDHLQQGECRLRIVHECYICKGHFKSRELLNEHMKQRHQKVLVDVQQGNSNENENDDDDDEGGNSNDEQETEGDA